ncbi:hypothetical protein A3J13_02445 [Candidatus Daviesbacteria bacterium RIFCSPLOWO2_02_FULL_36_8]|uniref:Large ribosomal subunit protein uL22 n=1 Tax=Candidatus Daviesbacteria bacterium RIFCSPLOWO2_02_FULL_36_8 TaxID=1797793 RepID=A0A1F5MFF9_9BACT|nr:MAG: hypothetical protein A3J13_02445 [Candidatus Daviesbacteria bacterium RIFCSPLOWO2_02_FULL_36_8]
MEIQTIQKYIHTSPRKLRLVADMVRKMEPNHALDVLRVTPKYAAGDLIKALETVLANAKVAGMDAGRIVFKKLEIDESMKMKRFRAGTRGRAKPYKKRMAHIKIVLTDDLNIKTQIPKIKKEKVEKKEEITRLPGGDK